MHLHVKDMYSIYTICSFIVHSFVPSQIKIRFESMWKEWADTNQNWNPFPDF
jgi:hypothetical protein